MVQYQRYCYLHTILLLALSITSRERPCVAPLCCFLCLIFHSLLPSSFPSLALHLQCCTIPGSFFCLLFFFQSPLFLFHLVSLNFLVPFSPPAQQSGHEKRSFRSSLQSRVLFISQTCHPSSFPAFSYLFFFHGSAAFASKPPHTQNKYCGDWERGYTRKSSTILLRYACCMLYALHFPST